MRVRRSRRSLNTANGTTTWSDLKDMKPPPRLECSNGQTAPKPSLGSRFQGLLNRRSHSGRPPSGQGEPHHVSRTRADDDVPPGRRTDHRQDRERQAQVTDHASHEQLHLGRIHRSWHTSRTSRPSARSDLRKPDVLTPWPLRTLPLFKRDSLSFAQLVEGGLSTGRLVEEVLVAVASRNEPEPLVAHE